MDVRGVQKSVNADLKPVVAPHPDPASFILEQRSVALDLVLIFRAPRALGVNEDDAVVSPR
jgi:hypothetical protein